jgi:hypothetical protein
MENNDLWKIVLVIVLLVASAVIVFGNFISAIELDLNKNQSCQLFNYTGEQCDSFWCISGMKGNWTNDSICLINITTTINETNQTNITYFNETLMREIAYNETLKILENSSFINASTLILVKNAILEGEENRTEMMVRSYMDDFTPNKEPFPTTVIIIIVVLLVGGMIGVSFFNSKKKEKSPWEEFEDQPAYDPRKPYKGNETVKNGTSKKGPPSPKDVKDFEKTGDIPEVNNEEDEE